jgi:DNA repair protein RadA/Sms
VLEFEGDRHQHYRILRSVKNRFGRTPELGIYEMGGGGLSPVLNPSLLFLSNEGGGTQPGVAIAPVMQGMRTLLVEVQALASTAHFGTPQRSATGFDGKRLQMLLAVLEKKYSIRTGDKDVFLNLAGGLKIDDPSLDLAVVSAIVSSLHDLALPPLTVLAAEVSLTGEVRPAPRLDARLAEAAKLGFEQAYISSRQSLKGVELPASLEITPVADLRHLFTALFG